MQVWIKTIFYNYLVFYCSEKKICACSCQTFPSPFIFANTYISLSLSLQHLLCIGERQVLQRTPLLIVLFFLLQILRVVIFILLLVSEISLLILSLGLPPWLESYVVSCVLLTSWNETMSFVHVIQYQISSCLFLITYIPA